MYQGSREIWQIYLMAYRFLVNQSYPKIQISSNLKWAWSIQYFQFIKYLRFIPINVVKLEPSLDGVPTAWSIFNTFLAHLTVAHPVPLRACGCRRYPTLGNWTREPGSAKLGTPLSTDIESKIAMTADLNKELQTELCFERMSLLRQTSSENSNWEPWISAEGHRRKVERWNRADHPTVFGWSKGLRCTSIWLHVSKPQSWHVFAPALCSSSFSTGSGRQMLQTNPPCCMVCSSNMPQGKPQCWSIQSYICLQHGVPNIIVTPQQRSVVETHPSRQATIIKRIFVILHRVKN